MLGLTIAVSMRVIGAFWSMLYSPTAMGAILSSRSLKQIFFLFVRFWFDIRDDRPLPVFSIRQFNELNHYYRCVFDHRGLFSNSKDINHAKIEEGFLQDEGWTFWCLMVGWTLLLNSRHPASAQEAVIASTSLAGAIRQGGRCKGKFGSLFPQRWGTPRIWFETIRSYEIGRGAKVVIYGGYEKDGFKAYETSKNKKILAIQIIRILLRKTWSHRREKSLRF